MRLNVVGKYVAAEPSQRCVNGLQVCGGLRSYECANGRCGVARARAVSVREARPSAVCWPVDPLADVAAGGYYDTRRLGRGGRPGDTYAGLGRNWLLSYPKPFFVYPYHQDVFPHLFKHKPKLLVPAWMSGFTAVVRQAVRPMLAAFPTLESLCRRLTPEHMQIPARQALPHADFLDSAPVKLIVFLERYNGSEPVIDRLDPITARRRVVGNHYFELGAQAQELMTACAATGLLGLEDWFGEMARVVDRVFGRLPIYRLRLAPMKPQPTGKAIASAVNELLGKM